MKRIAALMLILLVLPLAAFSEVFKEEVVYARLSLDGQASALYVINAFEADAETRVIDYGAYSRRLSLTDDRALPQSGEAAALTLAPGRYSYQGDGLEKPLPWIISLTATLDGQSIAPADLGGKSGQVALSLSVKNNPLAEAVSGYTLQVTVALDGNLCAGIAAPGGTIALAGSDRQVTYALLPGMEGEYSIAFRAENFRMDGIQAAGVRMEMDAQMYADLFTAGMADPAASMVRGLALNAITSMMAGDAVSFADARNPVRATQFILTTDSIERPRAEAQPVADEKTPQTFFQRLLALFGA